MAVDTHRSVVRVYNPPSDEWLTSFRYHRICFGYPSIEI